MSETVMALFGGVSTEHMVSCRSALNIISGLRAHGYEVVPVGITKAGSWLPFLLPDEEMTAPDWEERAATALAASGRVARPVASVRDFLVELCGGTEPDIIYPAVHGINCEDGALQGLLQLSGIPYVGSHVLASAACMDKAHAKIVVGSIGVPQVPHSICRRHDIQKDAQAVAKRVIAELGLPCFLKPANGGSSVGTLSVHKEEDLPQALAEAATYDPVVLVESFVNARELEVAVLGNDAPRAAAVGEIVKADSAAYYDYRTKYFDAESSWVEIPAAIPQALSDRVRRYALDIYRVFGCSGCARVDFFLDKDNGAVYFNEVNTLPGFTSISLYPKAFEADGLALPDLLHELCELAKDKHRAEDRRSVIED